MALSIAMLFAVPTLASAASSDHKTNSDLEDPVSIVLSGNHAFVTNYAGNAVTEFNASTGALVRVIRGKAYAFDKPRNIAVSGIQAFVVDAGDGKVTVFNTSTGGLVRVISGAKYDFNVPSSIAISGKRAFVVDAGYGKVTVFNTSTGALVRVISGKPYSLDLARNIVILGGDAFVANGTSPGDLSGGGSVTEFNASTGALVRVIRGKAYALDAPSSISISGNDAFVANFGSGFPGGVTEFNRLTGALVAYFGSGFFGKVSASTGVYRVVNEKAYDLSSPNSTAISGKDLFVVNDSAFSNIPSAVTEFNVRTGALIRVISGRAYGFNVPSSIAISGINAFVVSSGGPGTKFSGSITEFNIRTGALVRVIR